MHENRPAVLMRTHQSQPETMLELCNCLNSGPFRLTPKIVCNHQPKMGEAIIERYRPEEKKLGQRRFEVKLDFKIQRVHKEAMFPIPLDQIQFIAASKRYLMIFSA